MMDTILKEIFLLFGDTSQYLSSLNIDVTLFICCFTELIKEMEGKDIKIYI